MMSYAFNPVLCPARPSRPETPLDMEEHTAGAHRRRFEVIDEDVITLDYLIGVMLIKDEYSFVQYEPTDRHKRSAGTKNAPVQQINMFVGTLRDNSVMFESAICTVAESDQRTLWLRIQLSDLRELSLEPLWMIKGRVQLFAKQRYIAIAIYDRALGKISLDSGTAFLAESASCERDDERERESSLSTAPSPVGNKRNGDHSQPEYDAGETTSKRSKTVPECNNVTPMTRRQQKAKYNTKTRFNAKDRKVHRYKTRNVSKTAAVEAQLGSLSSKDVARAEPPLVLSFTSNKETSDRADETESSGCTYVTCDEQPCAVSTRGGTVQADVSQSPRPAIVDTRPALRDIRVREDPGPQLPPGDPSREDRASSKDKHRNCLLM